MAYLFYPKPGTSIPEGTQLPIEVLDAETSLAKAMPGCVAVNPTTGDVRESDGVEWCPYVDRTNVPKPPVVPLINGAEKPNQTFGDGSATIYHWRVCFNAIDDTDAQTILKNGWPGVAIIQPGVPRIIKAGALIKHMHIVAVGSATSGTLASGEVVLASATAANFGTADVKFDFGYASCVNEVRFDPLAAVSNNVDMWITGFASR